MSGKECVFACMTCALEQVYWVEVCVRALLQVHAVQQFDWHQETMRADHITNIAEEKQMDADIDI